MHDRDNLPEITLEHVEFDEESWNYGNRHGMSVGVFGPGDSDEPLLRWAVSYPRYVVVVSPKIEQRLVTFDRGDGTMGTERGVWVTIDPGLTRELTNEELAAEREKAREQLVLWLRHVAAAYRYLVPEGGQ